MHKVSYWQKILSGNKQHRRTYLNSRGWASPVAQHKTTCLTKKGHQLSSYLRHLVKDDRNLITTKSVFESRKKGTFMVVFSVYKTESFKASSWGPGINAFLGKRGSVYAYMLLYWLYYIQLLKWLPAWEYTCYLVLVRSRRSYCEVTGCGVAHEAFCEHGRRQ